MRKIERQLRERLKAVEQERDEIAEDRDVFRRHFTERFRWWVKLLGDKQSPNCSWLIEQDAKFLREVKWWFW
jgi:hypothetical protein